MTDKFIVANQKGLSALPAVVQKYRRKMLVNVYSLHLNKGYSAFHLGWNDRPDSDWGHYHGTKLRVIVPKDELWDLAEDAIRKGLGWEPLDRSSGNCNKGDET